MFKPLILIALGATLGWAQEAPAPDAAAEDRARAVQLRETIRQWIETETLISEEVATWEAKRATMRDLLTVYRAELAQLDELLEKAGRSAESSDQERQEMSAEIESMRTARAAFIEQLTGFQARALALVGRFPAPLQERLKPHRSDLEQLQAKESAREVTQALVAIVTGASEFNAAVNFETELREVGGKRLEMRVIYLGLSRAFFYAQNGASAGTGAPGPDGWVWESRPELAAAIGRAVAVVSKQERPDFVELPLSLPQ